MLCGGDGVVLVWDARTGETWSFDAHDFDVCEFCELPDDLIAPHGPNHAMAIWDLSAGSVQMLNQKHARDLLPAVLPDGRFVSGGSDSGVQLWDPESGEVERMERRESPYRRWPAACAEGLVASGDDDGFVCVWTETDGSPLHELVRKPGDGDRL